MKTSSKGILSAVIASVITGLLFFGLDYFLLKPTRPIQQYLILDLAWIVVWVAIYLLINRIVKKNK